MLMRVLGNIKPPLLHLRVNRHSAMAVDAQMKDLTTLAASR
jgi:hypothetical protein